jgi:hypothetical protein
MCKVSAWWWLTNLMWDFLNFWFDVYFTSIIN